ncbi:MAG: class I SAM-dependent methyltransferase [Polyangiales bacterium]
MTPSNHARWLPMKADHLQFLASPRWADMLKRDLLPWLLAGGSLGDDVLEIGPGPGLTTDLLRALAPTVTAVELDPTLARRLHERMAHSNVAVLHADAAHSGLVSGRFSAVTCFHVMHHVPTVAQQDAVFREVLRVLRPGGMFLCVDALDTERLRVAHVEHGETFLPLGLDGLSDRLQTLGFRQVAVQSADYQVMLRATG